MRRDEGANEPRRDRGREPGATAERRFERPLRAENAGKGTLSPGASCARSALARLAPGHPWPRSPAAEPLPGILRSPGPIGISRPPSPRVLDHDPPAGARPTSSRTRAGPGPGVSSSGGSGGGDRLNHGRSRRAEPPWSVATMVYRVCSPQKVACMRDPRAGLPRTPNGNPHPVLGTLVWCGVVVACLTGASALAGCAAAFAQSVCGY